MSNAFQSWFAYLEAPADEVDRVDAIVALAGGTGRLDAGLDLLLEGRAQVLLLSGTGAGVGLEEIFPHRDLSAVPDGHLIVLESRSTSTRENALEARTILEEQGGVHSIALITSDYHLPRAELVFREVFPDVDVHRVPVSDPDARRGRWWRSTRGRRIVLTEFTKWCLYRVHHSMQTGPTI